MRTHAGVYLVLLRLFVGKILGTYTGPKNPNSTFLLTLLDEVLDCYKQYFKSRGTGMFRFLHRTGCAAVPPSSLIPSIWVNFMDPCLQSILIKAYIRG